MVMLLLLGLFLLCAGILLEYGRYMAPAPSMESAPGPVVALIGLILTVISACMLLWRWLT